MTITSVKNRPVLTPPDEFTWPGDFTRIPDQEWTRQPVDQFGLNYDDVGNHGWYKNLEPTIAQVLATLEPGDLLVDYSSGTGILTRRLLDRIGHEVGILNVDASPKFLRVALETFRDDERVAFRLLRWLKAERRLQSLDEVAGPDLLTRGADALTLPTPSTSTTTWTRRWPPGPVSCELIEEHFDLRPAAFREYLKLHRPVYGQTAAYGHFGRDEDDFTWERTDKAQTLRESATLAAAER